MGSLLCLGLQWLNSAFRDGLAQHFSHICGAGFFKISNPLRIHTRSFNASQVFSSHHRWLPLWVQQHKKWICSTRQVCWLFAFPGQCQIIIKLYQYPWFLYLPCSKLVKTVLRLAPVQEHILSCAVVAFCFRIPLGLRDSGTYCIIPRLEGIS